MGISFTEIRGQAMGIESSSTQPSLANTKDGTLPAGKMYTDPTTGILYIYNGNKWATSTGTTTSTSTTSSSTSSTSSSSTSSTSSSSSTSSTSSSSSSSSTSTTLF